ncbi:unnamed protein product [Phytophthora fragariaefolia]|uniref:Unnamed protein product n=1 Tax=Phytophthora fragariaefolia TaxID=1490495 RepID=A0A9W6U993_9STRA|nr:unnamed protein product [Phytophthora fragariaefolia]
MPTPARVGAKICEITKTRRTNVNFEKLWQEAGPARFKDLHQAQPNSTPARLGPADIEFISSLVASAHAKYDRRTKDAGPFEIEVFVLAAKKPRNTMTDTRRATAPLGEIARAHWAISQARQPEGMDLSVPDTATFAQEQHLDAMRAEEATEVESVFEAISVRMNCNGLIQRVT